MDFEDALAMQMQVLCAVCWVRDLTYNAAYSTWAITPHPFNQQVASKTGAFDDTITVGNVSQDRKWIPHILAALLRRRTDLLFDGLDLPLYEKLVKAAADDVGLSFMAMCPHMCRHGGPSADALAGALSLEQIQQRGRWASLNSVRRYEKHAKLLRVAARLPPMIHTSCALWSASSGKKWRHAFSRCLKC